MTGGFRSVIAGVIGRFWSTGGVPPTPPNNGIPVASDQRAQVLIGAGSSPLQYDQVRAPMLFDRSRLVPLFSRYSLPLTFKAND